MSIPKDAPIKYATPMPPPSLQDIALVCPGGAAFFFVQAWELITILEARPDLVSRIRLIAANSAGSITGALLAYGIEDTGIMSQHEHRGLAISGQQVGKIEIRASFRLKLHPFLPGISDTYFFKCQGSRSDVLTPPQASLPR